MGPFGVGSVGVEGMVKVDKGLTNIKRHINLHPDGGQQLHKPLDPSHKTTGHQPLAKAIVKTYRVAALAIYHDKNYFQ